MKNKNLYRLFLWLFITCFIWLTIVVINAIQTAIFFRILPPVVSLVITGMITQIFFNRAYPECNIFLKKSNENF